MDNNLEQEFDKFVKGQKIIITLRDHRNLEGTFINKSGLRHAVILHNVSFVPSTGKSFQQLEFKLNEIEEVLCSEEEKLGTIKTEELASDKNDSLVSPSLSVDDGTKKFNRNLYDKINEIVVNHVLIDQIDEKFAGAVKQIEDVDCIAINGEGANQGRFGHLTILSLATNKVVFLLDTIKLGSTVFKAAGSILKKVLESKRILKVVHNCALLSDCLKHKYGIRLQNVFDTQACHFIITKNHFGHPPSLWRLKDLVTKYLKLPSAVCEDQILDPALWRRRPLQHEMIMAAAWRVALIRKLKTALDDALYAPFDKLCELYLSSIRDTDDEMGVQKAVQMQQKNGACPPQILKGHIAGESEERSSD